MSFTSWLLLAALLIVLLLMFSKRSPIRKIEWRPWYKVEVLWMGTLPSGYYTVTKHYRYNSAVMMFFLAKAAHNSDTAHIALYHRNGVRLHFKN